MMITIIFISNYVIAIGLLVKIANDDVWGYIMNDMLSGKTMEEQQQLIAHSDMLRKVFCTLLIVPGFGILLLVIGIIKLS